MKITTLALMFVALTAVKVSACGDGECEPTPEPEPEPPVVVIPDQPKVDGDSVYDPYTRIYYAICTCDKMKVAWGFESLELRTNKARSQCEIRRTERLKCPVKWK
jgi:hypothetical protein